MNQPLFEVRERKIVLILGIVLTFIFAGMGVASAVVFFTEGDISTGLFLSILYVALAFIGVYSVCAYLFHKLQVYSNNQMIYSSSFGKKKEFAFKDIAKVAGNNRKGTLNLTLYDAAGKRLARVESNMANYDQLCEWLDASKKTADEARATLEGMGMEAPNTFTVEPIEVRGTGKVARVFMAILGVGMLVGGAFAGISGISDMTTEPAEDTAAVWFDPYTDTEVKQAVSFEMISYQFASFELSDAQGMYFVFDAEMYPYIVCMDNNRLETEFAEIYEYTFSDATEVPKAGELEGYSMPIEEELKEIAIEEFNYLWGENVINESNFSDYFGDYYLDTTYIPEKEGGSSMEMILSAVFSLALGIYLIYYAVKGYQKDRKKWMNASQNVSAAKAPVMSEAGEVVQTSEIPEQSVTSVVGELPVPRNIIVTVIATLVGAAFGGILWMLFYKMGRIAAIAGYAAVLGAMGAWTKFGRRELKTMSTIWCIIAGAGMIVLANYISYAWEIVDVLNESNPGRAEFVKVLVSMPQMMTEWDLWGSFASDLAIGLVLALAAGASALFSKKKK